MNSPSELSSSLTFINKYVLPGIFLLNLPVFVPHLFCQDDHDKVMAVMITLGSAIALWWAWPLAKITISRDEFLISNFFRVHRVPFDHLQRISTHRWHRTPTISLHFEPPTPLGRHIRILPPLEFFGYESFNKIAAFLTAIIRHRETKTVAS